MKDMDSDGVRPMSNPPHLGELIRESMDEMSWNVTETAAHLGCERGTLSRLLNGKAGLSANMALALEAIGWGTAEHWMGMQASYELALARRDRAAAETRSRPRHAVAAPASDGLEIEHDTAPRMRPRSRREVTVRVGPARRAKPRFVADPGSESDEEAVFEIEQDVAVRMKPLSRRDVTVRAGPARRAKPRSIVDPE